MIDTSELFRLALPLGDGWFIEDVAFEQGDGGKEELHITLGFKKGAHFPCPEDGCPEASGVYDSNERTWRHLDFFQYKTYLHAPLPRMRCPEHGVRTADVPWARPGSGFTLLFEAFVLELARHLAVERIAKMVDEHDTRLWRFIKEYVDAARERLDFSEVGKVGVDETSRAKGHSYISLFVDLKERTVMYATEGKDHTTVDRFADDFKGHKGMPDEVTVFTCDMSGAFRRGVADNFKNAKRVIDKFHVIKLANDKVDATRRAEAAQNPVLKKTKYLWLKNQQSLTERQKAKKDGLDRLRLKTGRAYRMRVELQEVYEGASTRSEAEEALKRLCSWMARSRIEPMKKLAATLRENMAEILNYFDDRLTNAVLEGINSIVQNIKRRARGFKNPEYFKTMVYLGCSRLDLTVIPH